jgi:S-adenosylmethionine synthetase
MTRRRGWPWNDLATTNRIVIAGEVRGPASITPDVIEETAPAAVKDIGYEQEGFHWKTPRSTSCCMRSPPTSRRASTPPATRTKARATRASCSATPAARRRR